MVRPEEARLTSDVVLLDRLLAGCCAADEHLLETLLAERLPAAARRAPGGGWHLGVALLLGGALAMGAAGTATARESATPGGATPAPARPWSAPQALAVAPAEAAALVAMAYPTGMPAASGARAAVADTGLTPGLVLLVPSLAVDAQQGTSPTSQLYTVVAGDTLSAIAERIYGDASYWPLIFESNRTIIANPNLIFPGQTFNLPPAGTLTPGSQTGNQGGGQTGQGPGSYTVRAGDSLWSIAQFAYGNPYRWVDIYNANAALIGPDAGLIFSGTVLTIPA